jgi:isopentenyl diphosphate isomerase/L-lactate dehydrogenase-like FMN-dependent dehydrogenase
VIEHLAEQARALASQPAWAYLAGGSGADHTVRRNVEAWAALSLLPRALVGAGTVDTRLRLLGHDLDAPLLLAPTASHGLYHRGGEAETARGAGAARVVNVVSTNSTLPVADIGAAATGPWWFQLYVLRDRGFTRDLVGRAERAGASALVLTVDLPVQAPDTATLRAALGDHDGAVYGNLAGLDPTGAPLTNDPGFDPTLSWADVDWLRSLTSLPVLVKGILRAADAATAIEHGAAAVVVSNHGGRALDTTPATVDVLPSVVDAVAGRVPVLVDGGIRRGTDIAKAVALGATAVLVGRPVIWGLTADGANGVREVVATLSGELAAAMAMLGAPTLADLSADLLWRG